jgi:hypothetical protein
MQSAGGTIVNSLFARNHAVGNQGEALWLGNGGTRRALDVHLESGPRQAVGLPLIARGRRASGRVCLIDRRSGWGILGAHPVGGVRIRCASVVMFTAGRACPSAELLAAGRAGTSLSEARREQVGRPRHLAGTVPLFRGRRGPLRAALGSGQGGPRERERGYRRVVTSLSPLRAAPTGWGSNPSLSVSSCGHGAWARPTRSG